ncbi:unnamed protein product [Ectocarpus fasciculatus]
MPAWAGERLSLPLAEAASLSRRRSRRTSEDQQGCSRRAIGRAPRAATSTGSDGRPATSVTTRSLTLRPRTRPERGSAAVSTSARTGRLLRRWRWTRTASTTSAGRKSRLAPTRRPRRMQLWLASASRSEVGSWAGLAWPPSANPRCPGSSTTRRPPHPSPPMMRSGAPGLRAAGATAAVAMAMGYRRRRQQRRVEETGTGEGEGETIETGTGIDGTAETRTDEGEREARAGAGAERGAVETTRIGRDGGGVAQGAATATATATVVADQSEARNTPPYVAITIRRFFWSRSANRAGELISDHQSNAVELLSVTRREAWRIRQT